jgi:hypothetical protein
MRELLGLCPVHLFVSERQFISMARAKPLGFGIEVGKRKTAAILNAMSIPIPTPRMSFKPL